MAENRDAILKMHGINNTFGGLKALIEVDPELFSGEVLAIVGDNSGSGRSSRWRRT
jgi:ABC-type sugar transport system ATPase subunit